MTAAPAWLSPSLSADPVGGSFETKFHLPAELADAVEDWAAGRLALDPHAGGHYTVTSVYLDTPDRAVLRRAADAGTKYRVRRYGDEAVAHLERKHKRDGRVTKVRAAVPLDEVAAGRLPGWFAAETAGLVPACLVQYRRAAFGGDSGRLTLDRAAVGGPAAGWRPELREGLPLLAGGAILELKYRAALPAVFKDLVADFRLVPAGVSKYRRCGAALGLLS